MKREPVLTLAGVGTLIGALADWLAPEMPAGTVSAISGLVFVLARRFVVPHLPPEA